MTDQIAEIPLHVELPEDQPAPEAVELVVTFSDVAVKDDGSFVVTVMGNRCHVTPDYNASLYSAVQAYLEQGGTFTPYDEDVIVEADPALLAKIWIETSLTTSESLVSQYRDARDLGEAPPITADQFSELLTWRRVVREWPQAAGYPADASRPTTPDWFEAVLQNGQ